MFVLPPQGPKFEPPNPGKKLKNFSTQVPPHTGELETCASLWIPDKLAWPIGKFQANGEELPQ